MEDEKRVCSCCGKVLGIDEGTPYNGGEICDDCLENDFSYCDHCGCLIHRDDYHYVNGGDVICRDCADEHTIVCEHCDNRVYNSDSVHDDNTWLCSSCYNEFYHRCEGCNRIIHDDDIYWSDDYPYCSDCYDDECGEIEEYSYKPTPLFKGDGDRYFGVELEIDCGGKDSDNARRLKEIANSQLENIYIKSDGSLDDGFEIVSHPMTLDYHINEMNWEELMKEAVRLKYRSHETSTCGLHIHINRNAFGKNQTEQEDAISKILFFVEKHWNEMFHFSRRSEYTMNRWSARYGFEKTGREILDKAKSGYNGRYVAVNLNNYHTIEFRLFRGTLRYNTFIATLQMVNKICDVALSMSECEIDKMSWSRFVSTIEEKELIQYLKERRLYVNEIINESEEM